jgi:hypothetical protein
MGTLFALFVVFIAAQVWNDNDRATAAVAQEASALRAVVILATTFPGESRGRLEALIHHHIEEAVTKEWPMMARQTATLAIAPRHLVEALQLTLALTPSSQSRRSHSVRWRSRLNPLSTHAVSASSSASRRWVS